MKAENDKWITIKPNGEDSKGRHLLLKDGESPKDAIDRVYKKQDKQSETYKKITDEYKEYFSKSQLKEFEKELARFDKYKGLKNVDWNLSKEQFLKMKPEDALKTLKDTNDLHEKWEKEDILKERFDNYVKKLNIKDSRLSELRRFIGSWSGYFTDKTPTFDEFKQDTRYGFDTALALKYLADEKGFEHFDNISDREMAKEKAGYEKFKEILSKDNKGTKKMKAENRIDLKIDNKGKGRRFESRFLEAGLVKYSFGVCLLNKDALNNFVYKFVGCPVIIDHKDITDENAKDERVGVISKVWYNEFDGWFWCEGVVFDDEAISLIKDKGYNVSCQYNIDDYTENTANALHNGNPYDLTILDGTPEHLAIVKNPRYEEALIAVNKGEDMKAENTEFRTGYDSEGEAYVYPLEGADKSEKKETKKEDKKKPFKIPSITESLKKDYEDGKITAGEVAKELSRANLTPYLFDDKEALEKIGIKEDKKEDKVKDLYEKEYKKALKEIEEGKDYAQINYNTNIGEMKSALSHLKKFDSDWDKYDVYENIKEYDDLSDDWNKEQIGRIAREKAAQETLKKWISEGKDRTNEYYKIYEPHKLKDKKQPKQLKLFNALEEQLERFVSLVAKNFDESKHKRDDDGKFTDSGNFSGESVDEQEAKLVKELKRLEKNGQDVSEIYKKLTGKEWGKKEDQKGNKPFTPKSQKSDSVKFDKIGKVLTSILKDAEKSYKESK